jgi:hypothetical protein
MSNRWTEEASAVTGSIRKGLAVVAVGMLLGGLVPLSAGAGQGCVSRREYRRVDIGMRKARVHRIFDTRGEVIDEGPNFEERAYDICPRFEGVVVFVSYEGNRVTEKSWILGE